MATLLKEKITWITVIAVAVITVILSFANLGSIVSPAPKDMPVALVNLDEGATIPGKGETNFGELMEEKMTTATSPSGDEIPLLWTKLDSEQAANDALAAEEFYAAVVLPADMSKKLITLQSPAPQQAEVKILINQGKNYAGANSTGQILDKVMAAVNGQLREQMLTAIKARGDVLNTAQAGALAAPLLVTQEIQHPVGTNSANGNAPVILSQMLWIASVLAALLLWFAGNKAVQGGARKISVIAGQLLVGLLSVVLSVFILLGVAIGILDLEVPDFWELTLFLLFAATCFYFAMSMIYAWIGIRGTPIIVMIFFFSLPVLTMPEQFVPDVTRDWLLSWVPLRFAADGIRDILYYGEGLNLTDPAWTLAAIGAGGLVLTLLSGLRKPRVQTKATAEQAAQ